MRKIVSVLTVIVVLPIAFILICAMMTGDIVAAQVRRARG